jgi:choline dehydrogenase-like flavoprotein
MVVVHQPVSHESEPSLVSTPHPGAGPGVPNDQAASTAETERRRRSAAAAVPPVWVTALGALLPPEAKVAPLRASPNIDPDTLRTRAFKAALSDPGGLALAEAYLVEAQLDAFRPPLRDAVRNASADRPGFLQLEAAIAALTAAKDGDLNVASLRILASLALLTEDGKAHLRATEAKHGPLTGHLEDFIGAHLGGQDEASKASRQAYTALLRAIQNPQSAGAAAPTGVAPAPLMGPELDDAKKLIGEIQAAFPPGASPAPGT